MGNPMLGKPAQAPPAPAMNSVNRSKRGVASASVGINLARNNLNLMQQMAAATAAATVATAAVSTAPSTSRLRTGAAPARTPAGATTPQAAGNPSVATSSGVAVTAAVGEHTEGGGGGGGAETTSASSHPSHPNLLAGGSVSMDWDAVAASSAGLSAGLSAGGLSAGAAATMGGGGGNAAAAEMEMARRRGEGEVGEERPRGFSSGVKVQSSMKPVTMKPVTSCPSLGELGGGGRSDDRRSRRSGLGYK